MDLAHQKRLPCGWKSLSEHQFGCENGNPFGSSWHQQRPPPDNGNLFTSIPKLWMINDPYHNGTQRPNGIYRLWKLLINGGANDWQKWPSIVPLNNFGFHFLNDAKFLLIIVLVRVPVCITSMKAIWVSTTTAASLEANKTQDKLLLSRRKWAVSRGELSSNYPPRLPRSALCFMCFSTSANFPQGTMRGMSGMLNKDKKFPQRVRTLNLLLAQRATFQLDFRLERKFAEFKERFQKSSAMKTSLEDARM